MSLPEHWLDSQKLALGLNLLSAGVGTAEGSSIAATVSGCLPRNRHARMALHPGTLKLLIDKGPNYGFGHVREICKLEFERLHGASGRLNPLAGAKLVADRILVSNLRAPQIGKLAQSEVGCRWDSGADASLQSLLDTLRDRRKSTTQRLHEMSRFRKYISGHRLLIERWKLIENAILQQWFVWPLLVSNGLNFSLPLMVDVSWTDSQELGRVDVLNNRILDLDRDFDASLRKSREAALQLWLNKHMSWPPRFIRHIEEHLVVTIDFGAAESIIGPYYSGTHITLTGGSAGLYFVLAILSKLVNPNAMEGICATGIIGRERPDREGGADHWVTVSGGIPAKYDYAQENYFSSFITNEPQDGLPPNALHVSRINNLSEAAGSVFGQQWRKHRYVRTPDLAFSFRPGPRQGYTGDPPDEDVDSVVCAIKASTRPILRLNTSGRNVAQALYYINHKIQAEFETGEKARNLGTFAFVRTVPDEINDRFWRTVWSLLNGEARTFEQFQFASTSFAAAEVLAREFNRQPYHEARRAPDLLVVVLCDNGQIDEAGITAVPNGPFSRHKIRAMEKRLNDVLKQTPVPGLKPWLGQARIALVVEDPGMELVPVSGSTSLEDELHEALDKLSVFRFGFTNEMARRLLKFDDIVVDKYLEKLKKRKFIRFAHGAGEYMLVATERREPLTGHQHYDAALAIMGYLDPGEDARRWNLTESLAPHWIHEAQWHLHQAIGLEVNKKKRDEYWNMLGRVSRLDLYGWTYVRWITNRLTSGQPAESGDEVLEALHNHLESRADRKFLESHSSTRLSCFVQD